MPRFVEGHNYVDQLQQMNQKRYKTPIRNKHERVGGPDHAPIWFCQLECELGKAEGKFPNWRVGNQRLAFQILDELGQI